MATTVLASNNRIRHLLPLSEGTALRLAQNR
jgi:hypothetical protein